MGADILKSQIAISKLDITICDFKIRKRIKASKKKGKENEKY